MNEHAARVMTTTVEALKTQPLSLALIVVNVLFLIAGGMFVYYLGGAIRDERTASAALLKQVIENCRVGP